MKKKVVIVGGGFGGLKAAKTLASYSELVQVVVVDKRNYHLFQPLLYQVATAGLSPADIAAPIRQVLSEHPNVSVLMDEISGIDLKAMEICSETMELHYDYLILACGATHSYFGKDDWEEFAPGLKTLEMATEIRRRILNAFESAEKEINPLHQQKWLTFIIVGAGPTGVELAGSISEIAKKTMEKDFRVIRPKLTKIIIIEAGKKVLGNFDSRLSEIALNDLNSLGVEVVLETRVIGIDSNGVTIKSISGEKTIAAATVIWAAGVKPSPLNKFLNEELDSAGRVFVTENLSLKNYREVFVIGDQVHFETATKKVLPGLAPVAIQMGEHAAQNIIRQIRGEMALPFTYRDKGQMATIGRRLAVMEYKKFKARGMLAWLAWLFVHIYYLIGFKNRLFVMIQWIWSYLTFFRGARLITRRDWRE